MKLRKMSGLLLVCAMVFASGAPATAASPTKVKRGTYKVTSSTKESVNMVVASCGSSSCLSSAPSQGSENELHLDCVNTSGGGDAINDYEDYGPQKISRIGKIRTSTTQKDDGDTKTFTYTWTLTASGTLRGTARLAVQFADGGTCDSGTIAFNGHIKK